MLLSLLGSAETCGSEASDISSASIAVLENWQKLRKNNKYGWFFDLN